MSILLAPVHLRGSLRSPIAFKIGALISGGSFCCPASIRARSEACVCGTEIWLYHQLKQVGSCAIQYCRAALIALYNTSLP